MMLEAAMCVASAGAPHQQMNAAHDTVPVAGGVNMRAAWRTQLWLESCFYAVPTHGVSVY